MTIRQPGNCCGRPFLLADVNTTVSKTGTDGQISRPNPIAENLLCSVNGFTAIGTLLSAKTQFRGIATRYDKNPNKPQCIRPSGSKPYSRSKQHDWLVCTNETASAFFPVYCLLVHSVISDSFAVNTALVRIILGASGYDVDVEYQRFN